MALCACALGACMPPRHHTSSKSVAQTWRTGAGFSLEARDLQFPMTVMLNIALISESVLDGVELPSRQPRIWKVGLQRRRSGRRLGQRGTVERQLLGFFAATDSD